MNQKLYTAIIAVLVLAIIACSDNVSGSSEDPNVLTAETDSSSGSDVEMSSSVTVAKSSSSKKMESSSSASKKISSSSTPLVLCKVSGEWGDDGGCVRILPSGKGDLWSLGDRKVKTDAFAKDSSKFGDRAGDFFFETDSLEGSKTRISFGDGRYAFSDFQGKLNVSFFLNKEESSNDPFVKVGFYVAGFDSNGVALSADVSNWNGLCFLFSGTVGPILQLDLGDSINQRLGNALPSVTMSTEGVSQCFEWSQFKQANTDGEHEVITGDEAAKHVVRVVLLFRESSYPSGLVGFEILAIGTNRDE